MKSQPIKSKLPVNLKTATYPIYIGSDLFPELSMLLTDHNVGRKILIITDNTVSKLYGDWIVTQLKTDGYDVSLYAFPEGERSKDNSTVDQIYTWMLEKKMKRDVTIIALGGGVVGDLAGFVAATFLRGVRFIQIPTTLLAQVDSSVGGKVGINHRLGKNVIGSFYHPLFVLVDPKLLKTLTRREINGGIAEIIKYSLIKDINLFAALERDYSNFYDFSDWNWIVEVIRTCCSIKTKIVELDERENGLRRILNFGHTVGHALEAATDYGYFIHGEAVLYGMIAALYVSHELNYIDDQDFERMKRLITAFQIPPIPAWINDLTLIERIDNDKKQLESGLHFVCLDGIGTAKIEIIDDRLLRSSITFLLHDS